MAILIVDKDRSRLGTSRAEQAENIRKVYGGSGGISDANLDKLKYVERKLKEKYGQAPNFIPSAEVDR